MTSIRVYSILFANIIIRIPKTTLPVKLHLLYKSINQLIKQTKRPICNQRADIILSIAWFFTHRHINVKISRHIPYLPCFITVSALNWRTIIILPEGKSGMDHRQNRWFVFMLAWAIKGRFSEVAGNCPKNQKKSLIIFVPEESSGQGLGAIG